MPPFGKKKFTWLNKRVQRLDGVDKVTGAVKYAGDIHLPGMAYAGVVRSPHAHAKVMRIDASKALAIPGVLAVITAQDAPRQQCWADYYYLTNHVLYVGDVVAIVAAETPELVRKAAKAVFVEYEELPGIFTIEDALAPNAPHIREKGVGLNAMGIPDPELPGNVFYQSYFPIRKGNVAEGFAKSDIILEKTFRTPMIEHAYIEPEACVVHRNPIDNVYTAYASCQNPYFTRRYLAEALELPVARVKVIQSAVGGSFGGKEELIGLMVGRAAMLCKKIGRPIKLVASREDSFLESAKRHPFRCSYKVGLTKAGKIMAWEGTLVDNSGAYNNQTQYLNVRAAIHSAGAYNIPHVKTDTYGVFTNSVHGGAMRGYSSPQLIFGQEMLMNEAARAVGLDPVEFRRINLLKQGDATATGQILDCETVTHEMLDFVTERTGFKDKFQTYEHQPPSTRRKGIGVVTCFRGCGLGAEGVDASGATLMVTEDGSVIANCGLVDNGQGLKTAFAQIAAEGLGISPDQISFIGVDTSAMPDGGMTVASRGTTQGAQAMRKAGLKLGAMLRETAASMMEFAPREHISAENVVCENGMFYLKTNRDRRVSLKEVCGARHWSGQQMAVMEWYVPPALSQSKTVHTTGQGDAFPCYAYTCCVAEVEVDTETGWVEVEKVTAAHDLGTVINPGTALGQIYGGIVMGQGFAVSEEVTAENGHINEVNLDEYIIPTSLDMPKMEAHLFECEDPNGTYGAKSLGEPSTEAVGAAIAGAVGQALGITVTRLPINLERVVLGHALRGKEEV